ncbi:MAG: RlmE family RNA methyltransferase [Gammaproteobacteria bacterium]|jgi:23S rRNA (uridine2552-2'-O)-methyltransferase|nr:RlmE family RNA methyltransferase [Gammaproteobacteria bacterium]
MVQHKHSKQWLRQHADDEFVRRARQEGYRSRAAYKLREIDERYRVLRPDMIVVDLGAAPGGWSQYARQKVGNGGRVVAQDILPMDPLPGVDFLLGDIRDSAVLDLLITSLSGASAGLVISDMSPNISGDRVSDQARAVQLGELALEVAAMILAPGGQLLLKVFQGDGADELRREVARRFDNLVTCKPRASRTKSREIYLFAKGFLGN